MPKTGLTGTISLSVSGLSFSFTKIGEYQQTRAKDNVSHLGSADFEELEPGDLGDPGEVEVEGWYEGDDDFGDINEDAETVTVTYPKSDPDAAAAANLAGTGFLIMLGLPSLEKGVRNKRKFKVAFDGKTGPAYTAESPGSSS
ncbi:MAG: hypothetical protein MUE50_05500 [Pirellulaceae bacterium]|jgi:hypothetical protein|nr:hypothetical protein [Pirellulaceae bacterium]